jgi:hypothetical protein
MGIELAVILLGISCVSGLSIWGLQLIRRQAGVMQDVLDTQLKVAHAALESCDVLEEFKISLDKTAELSRCPTCRANNMLRGATYHG